MRILTSLIQPFALLAFLVMASSAHAIDGQDIRAMRDRLYVLEKQVLANDNASTASIQEIKKLAETGLADAATFIGYALDNGIGGMSVNPALAAQYFKAAASMGDEYGYANLGILFMYGRGVKQNTKTAKEMLTVASRGKITPATINLAMLIEQERGYKEAAALFQSVSGSNEYPFASTKYANMLLSGSGVGKNTREAVMIYKKAAEQWDAEAQFALVKIYSYGIGVAENNLEAAMWSEILQQNKNAVKGKFATGNYIGAIGDADLNTSKRSAQIWVDAHPFVASMQDYSKTIYRKLQ